MAGHIFSVHLRVLMDLKLLCRGEKEIDFQYSNIDWAQGQVEKYFEYMSEQKSDIAALG